MGFTMKKILKKFNDCDIFSLIGKVKGIKQGFSFKYKIGEQEFDNALKKIKIEDKDYLKTEYESFKDNLLNYPDFETIYSDIEKECYEFNGAQNKPYCSFIVDKVGKTTKYGKEHTGFFRVFYDKISYNIDRENIKSNYCIKDGENLLKQIPEELKNSFLYYEISFTSPVNISTAPMIIYYFKLNDESKKYLLKFKNDFEMKYLEDLTLYKDNKVMFYSCTHERFNSIKINYKEMSVDDIADFVNDEYPNRNNDIIINTVIKIINMNMNTKFSFKELGVNDNELMKDICYVCAQLKIKCLSVLDKNIGWSIKDKSGNKIRTHRVPIGLFDKFCDIYDLIEKCDYDT